MTTPVTGCGSRVRVQGVVPVAVEVVWEQADGGHVRVGDLDIGGVDAVVAFGMHAKARLGGGRRDQLDSTVTPLHLLTGTRRTG